MHTNWDKSLGKVYISYSYTDGKDFAYKVANQLKEKDISPWINSSNIQDSILLNQEIRRALQSALCIVLIVSTDALESRYVKSEWESGISRYLPIIPMIVENVDLPQKLKRYDAIQCEGRENEAIADLIFKIENIFETHLKYLSHLTQQAKDEETRKDIEDAITKWQIRFASESERSKKATEKIEAEINEEKDRLRIVAENRTVGQRIVGQRLVDISSHFRNRETQTKRIAELIMGSEARLISVIGRGGIGKTAVVSKVLRQFEAKEKDTSDTDIHVDGIVYLSTRTKGITLERIFLDCAQMLGGEQETKILGLWKDSNLDNDEKISGLLNTLGDGLYIILLDNMEDLLEAGRVIDSQIEAFLDISLRTPHNARLLLTSREPINFDKELMRFDYRVEIGEGLPENDALEVLRDLDPNHDYGIRDADESVLLQIIRAVHGVPRALEIVASILANDPFISIDELLAQKHIFQRDEFVEELVRENYKRLDSNSRRVMEALAIYGRPVPMVAVDYLLSAQTYIISIRDVLIRLIDLYVVKINKKDKLVSLHPIDQDYVYGLMLSENWEHESNTTLISLHSRAAEYYAELEVSTDKWLAIQDIEPQLFQFDHLIQARNYDLAATLLSRLDNEYLLRWGYAQRIKEMRILLDGHLDDRKDLLEHHQSMGLAEFALGFLDESIDRHEKALKIARELGEKATESSILTTLANALRRIANYEKALQYSEYALALARNDGHIQNQADITVNMGNIYWRTGNYTKAKDLFQEATDTIQSIAEPLVIDTRIQAYAVGGLGSVLLSQGELEKSIIKLQEALDLFASINYPRGQAFILESIGRAYLNKGELDQALDYCSRALSIQTQINSLRGMGHCEFLIGRIFRASNNLSNALQSAQSAYSNLSETNVPEASAAAKLRDAIQFRISGDFLLEVEALFECSKSPTNTGDIMEAVELAKEAHILAVANNISELIEKIDFFIADTLSNVNTT